jgi:TolA-binding protein
MKSLFGLDLSPDFLLKLLALVFALGVLVQRVDSQAEATRMQLEQTATTVRLQLQSSDTTNLIRFTDLQQRLNRVENKLDKLP